MSGHSKWSSIKHKKGAADAKRGKIFTKLIKEISVAAKNGGGDSDKNARLRTAILAAKTANMPNDNISRAVKKGTGELGDGANYEEITYEGFGPSKVAVLVDAMTDNKNRTVADLRSLFTRSGGNLGETGSVSWMFTKRGIINILNSSTTEDALMEVAIEAGADDVVIEDTHFVVYTDPNSLDAVRDAIDKKGIKMESAEAAMIPQNTVKVAGDDAESVLKFIEKLEDHDDVQKVHANFDISEEDMTRIMEGSEG